MVMSHVGGGETGRVALGLEQKGQPAASWPKGLAAACEIIPV